MTAHKIRLVIAMSMLGILLATILSVVAMTVTAVVQCAGLTLLLLRRCPWLGVVSAFLDNVFDPGHSI